MKKTEEVAISINGVSKNFRLPHQKADSIKSLFVNPLSLFGGKQEVEVQHALKDISFDIKRGEFFGIVGRNGSGKSTLLKILAGIYQPTKGSVSVAGRLVPFIELGVGFNPELTGRENVFLSCALNGFSEKKTAEMYDDIVDFAELEPFMDQKLKNYSSGMQVRLAFAVATRAKADILLIDEVLAVGDADFQRKCFNYFKLLKRSNTTVVFVTHDMDAVREFCDRAALVEDSRLVGVGAPSDIARDYSLLFIDNAPEGASKIEGERWGEGGAVYDSVVARLTKDYVVVEAKVDAVRSFDKLMFGIHIHTLDGKEVVATNNRMLRVGDVNDVKEGERIQLTWKMLSVFNDGEYVVGTTIATDDGTVLDWWTGASSFRIKRLERSTTAILPPTTVEQRRL